MQREQLLELRSRIVKSTQEIALRGEGSPAERLQVLLNIVRNGDATIEVLTKAYELAELSDGDDNKLTALLDVLYEVDARISAEDANAETDDADTPEPEQPPEQHQDQQSDQHYDQ